MPVNPLHLLVAALGFALAFIIIASAFYDFRIFRRRKSARKSLYRCADCRKIYEESHRTPLARCPICGKQNEPVRE